MTFARLGERAVCWRPRKGCLWNGAEVGAKQWERCWERKEMRWYVGVPTHFSCSAALHTTQNVSTYLLHRRTIWYHNICTLLQTADISLQHKESQTRLIFCLILCYRCLWAATVLYVQMVQTASKGKIHYINNVLKLGYVTMNSNGLHTGEYLYQWT
jgi:hypothetical protein